MTRVVSLTFAAALVFAPAAAHAANLLVNPGFENPVLAGGDVPGAIGWNAFGAAFTIKVAPHSGDNAFKTFGGTSGIFQDFAAAPGQSWKGSAWILNPSFDALAGAQIAVANIEWRDALDNLIAFKSGTPQVDASTPQGSGAAGYVQATVSDTAPAGTTKARFVLLTGAFAGPGGGAPFFDDASFELVPEPSAALLAIISLAGTLGLARGRR